MKFLLAPDSFKECASALTVAEAIQKGILRVDSGAECDLAPMADGGDGTVEVLKHYYNCEPLEFIVQDPLGRPVQAQILFISELNLVWIEVAQACGIMHLKEDEKNPFLASSFGVGQLLEKALALPCQEIVLSLGGTGTSDGGMGMLRAMGGEFYIESPEIAKSNPSELLSINKVNLDVVREKLAGKKIQVLCDVTNPLLGPEGATYVFAKQKGAKEEELPLLEEGMKHFADCVENATGKNVRQAPGAGAAGGLGFAFYSICDACFTPGADYMIGLLGIEDKIKACDWVITGEGRFDQQSLKGKLPIALARVAKKYQKPVVIMAGSVGDNVEEAYKQGVTAAFSIQQSANSLVEALAKTESNLAATAANIVRLID